MDKPTRELFNVIETWMFELFNCPQAKKLREEGKLVCYVNGELQSKAFEEFAKSRGAVRIEDDGKPFSVTFSYDELKVEQDD